MTTTAVGGFSLLKSVNFMDYRWVLLTASLMAFHFILTGFIAAGGRRKKTFTPEFLEKNFREEHEAAFAGGSEKQKAISKEGYPDTGSGRYSAKLGYKEWFEFNVGQRIHYHYLESVTSVICWLLIAGLLYPWVAVAFGGAYIVGRIIFHLGYSMKGPKGRVIGFLVC